MRISDWSSDVFSSDLNGSYQQANPQISVLVGGNEALAPETSKSWVLGGVYSPSFLPGFSVEANYYDIEVNGAIQTVDAQVTVANCVVRKSVVKGKSVSVRVDLGGRRNLQKIHTD